MSLLEQIFPKVRAEILRLLFTDPQKSLHLRDIARLSGLAIGTIQREVANMRQSGLLLEQRDGNRLYFRANIDNPIFTELQGLALKTTGLTVQIGKALHNIKGVQLAFIYGSFAAGTPTPDSDIDIMIIGNAGLRTIAPKLSPVSDKLDREINTHIFSENSFIEKVKSEDAYIMNVTKNPKLWIIGSEDEFAKLAEKQLASTS